MVDDCSGMGYIDNERWIVNPKNMLPLVFEKRNVQDGVMAWMIHVSAADGNHPRRGVL